jgi:hypothetical protein
VRPRRSVLDPAKKHRKKLLQRPASLEITLPVQPVDATPSNQLIRQYFP